jgi:hypothetical protein
MPFVLCEYSTLKTHRISTLGFIYLISEKLMIISEKMFSIWNYFLKFGFMAKLE